MKKYEVMFIMNPTVQEEAEEEIINRIKSIINSAGEVEKVDKWGKQRLAYEIKNNTEGLYYVVNYAGNETVNTKLKKEFRINDKIIREMIIRLDK